MNSSASNMSNFNITLIDDDDDVGIGGIRFLLKYFGIYFPYTLFTVLGILIGILGNLLIIGAILVSKEMRSSTNYLILNLSLADLILSTFVGTFKLVGIFAGKTYFDQNAIFCEFIAAICFVTCETSLINIGLLSINRYGILHSNLRYIKICHSNLYKKIFNFRNTILFCLLTWFIAFLLEFGNIFKWGGHYFDKKTLNCVWNRLASHSFSIFFPMSSIIIPCVCILFCYIRIFLFSSKVKVSRALSTKKNEFNRSIRIAKGLFASFMLYSICWLPFGLVVMIDFQDTLPNFVYAYTMLIAHLNSSFNPLLYAFCNPQFQKGYKQLLILIFRTNKLSCCCSKYIKNIETSTSNNQYQSKF